MPKKKLQSKYYLVLFVSNNNDQEVDIVPKSWITFDQKKNKITCKFMPGPYDLSSYEKLQSMVKNCEDPVSNWSEYSIEIRGKADTYTEAEERLKILNSKPYAFTTENEESAKLKALHHEKLFKIKTTNKFADLKNKLRSTDFSFNNSNSLKKMNSKSLESQKSSGVSSSDSSAADEEQVKQTKMKKKSQKISTASSIKHKSRALSSVESSSDSSTEEEKVKQSEKGSKKNDNILHSDAEKDKFSQHDLTLSLFENGKHSQPKLTGRDSLQVSVVEKYFISISKQIGQLNSLLVQNIANFNVLSAEVSDIKRKLDKKCSCDGDRYADSDKNSNDDESHEHNENNELQNAREKIIKFDFPIDIKEVFEDFNKQLNDPQKPQPRKLVITRIRQLINEKDTLNKNMSTIIKAYITRNVATLYVPSKTTNKANQNKPIFKMTPFYSCIEDAMRQVLKSKLGNDLSDKEILDAMASSLRNSRDWDGHRLLRTLKPNPTAAE